MSPRPGPGPAGPGPRRARRRPRRGAVAAVLAAALAGLVAGPAATAAAWTDEGFASMRVRVAPLDCSGGGAFTARASSALVAGTLQGAPVGGTAALASVDTGDRTSAASLSRPLVSDDAGSVPLVAGNALPIAVPPRSSWDQTARTSGAGASSASAGGAAPIGTVDVSGLLARAPAATAQLPGLSGVGLAVGPVSAAATLDGCRAGWGDADALTRSATTSSLGLRFTDAGVAAAAASMRDRGAAALTAVGRRGSDAAPAVARAASDGLLAAVQQALAARGPAGATGSAVPGSAAIAVTTTGTAGVTATGTAPRTAGTATLDPATGAAAVDLVPALTSGGHDADVLTATRVGAAGSDLAAALRQRGSALSDALTAARDGAGTALQAQVDVSITSLGITARVATVTWSSTPAGGSAPSAASLAAGTAVLPRAQVVALGATSLDALGLGGLGDAVTGLLGAQLLPKVQRALADSYLQPAGGDVTTATTGIAADADGAAAPLAAHLGALPAVLSVVGDQRATTAADAWTGGATPGVGLLTALRVRVRDGTGVRADLFLGNVAVGPDRPAFR